MGGRDKSKGIVRRNIAKIGYKDFAIRERVNIAIWFAFLTEYLILIPRYMTFQAFDHVSDTFMILLNIKSSFLDISDDPGFSMNYISREVGLKDTKM